MTIQLEGGQRPSGLGHLLNQDRPDSNWIEDYARNDVEWLIYKKMNLLLPSVAKFWIHFAKTRFLSLNCVQNSEGCKKLIFSILI